MFGIVLLRCPRDAVYVFWYVCVLYCLCCVTACLCVLFACLVCVWLFMYLRTLYVLDLRVSLLVLVVCVRLIAGCF